MSIASQIPSAKIQLEHVGCDLCGSSESSLLMQVPEIVGYFKEGDRFDVRRCGACELMYVSPRPVFQDIGRYYDSSTYYAHQADGKEASHKVREEKKSDTPAGGGAQANAGENFHKKIKRALRSFNGAANRWYKDRLAIRYFGYPVPANTASTGPMVALEKIILWLPYMRLRLLSKDLKMAPWRGEGRALDVGCGAGLELLALRAKGWSVRGVELSAKGASEARETNGLDVLEGRLEDLRVPSASADLILFGNSLEHVHSPQTALIEARRILAPGGLVIIKVPNIDSWEARLFKTHWFQLDVPRHLYHLTPKTVRALLLRAGFRVTRVTFDAGATYGFRESLRWKRLSAGKSDFKNRKLYAIIFWWMNALACLFRRGGQLVVFAEPAER